MGKKRSIFRVKKKEERRTLSVRLLCLVLISSNDNLFFICNCVIMERTKKKKEQ